MVCFALFCDRVSWNSGWPYTCYVAKDFELILLPPPPNTGIIGMHSHSLYDAGDETRTVDMLGKHFSKGATSCACPFPSPKWGWHVCTAKPYPKLFKEGPKKEANVRGENDQFDVFKHQGDGVGWCLGP